MEKLKNFTMLHGHCVGLGCVAAARISCLKGTLSETEADDIKHTMASFELPTTVDGLIWKEVFDATKSDKKMEAGRVKFVLLNGIGDAYVDHSLSEDEIRAGFEAVSL